MNPTIRKPLLIGVAAGLIAGVTTVTDLSFLTPGITDNAIGFYGILFLLSAALGGPLAGALSSTLFVIIGTIFGAPDMREILSDPIIFWSNLLALGTTVALVGLAYRWIFDCIKMPVRMLAWGGIVLAYYAIGIPSSVIPQYLLFKNPASEILPAVLYGYETYYPQAIFDIFFTSLVFIALPKRYRRPLWVEAKKAPA